MGFVVLVRIRRLDPIDQSARSGTRYQRREKGTTTTAVHAPDWYGAGGNGEIFVKLGAWGQQTDITGS